MGIKLICNANQYEHRDITLVFITVNVDVLHFLRCYVA